MASVTTTPYDSSIEDIKLKFAFLHETLNRREEMLIKDIQNEKDAELKDSLFAIQDLKDMNEFIRENTRNNALGRKRLEDNEREIAQLESQIGKDNHINPVSWGEMSYDDLCKVLNKIDFEVPEKFTKTQDEFTKTQNDQSNYSNRVCALYQGGITGKSAASDQLAHANHIAIDETTQNIYVSDFQQNCIVVFDNKANIISKFSDGIKFPRAIACKNNRLYLIENLHSMRHVEFKSFELSPKISVIPGKKMKVPADLSHVYAFDVSSEEVWYVCSRRANKLFSLRNSIFRPISSNPPFESPTDVKTYAILYLLESQSDCLSRIRLMNHQGDTIQFLPLKGIVEPLYFDVDTDGCFILSLTNQDAIVVCTREGRVIHKIQSSQVQCISHPKGIAVNKDGQIVVITSNLSGCLLIF